MLDVHDAENFRTVADYTIRQGGVMATLISLASVLRDFADDATPMKRENLLAMRRELHRLASECERKAGLD